MKSGVKITKDKRDYKGHIHYGAVSPLKLPDEFNVDAGITFPDQNSDKAFTECTGYTQTDNETDITKRIYTPDFSYAAGLEAEGSGPSENGVNLRASLQGVINRGVLEKKFAPISAKEYGELFVSDIRNWLTVSNKAEKPDASYRLATSGPYDIFDNIRSAIFITKKGVSAGSAYYSAWLNGPVMKLEDDPNYTMHNYAIKGWKQINGAPHLIIKPWVGKSLGDNGLFYMPREVCNLILSSDNAEAFVITPDGNRIWSILSWAATKFVFLVPILPRLYPIFFNGVGNVLYETAKNNLGKSITLDPNIPSEVGCAEAVSYCIKQAGIDIPEKGIAGTAALYQWLKTNPRFQEIYAPEKGAIIISPTGYGNGSVRGHTGILGGLGVMYQDDYGICSNDSQTGLFLELWTHSDWIKWYRDKGGLPVCYFKLK